MKPRRREPELFVNRELSWLSFNTRVLEEAADPSNPALERLKFATIVASNLDEFFMVRVAALLDAVEEGDLAPDAAGLNPPQQLTAIAARAHEMVERLYEALHRDVLPALAQRGIRIVPVSGLDPDQRAGVARQFRDGVLHPLLMAVNKDQGGREVVAFLSCLLLQAALDLRAMCGAEMAEAAINEVREQLAKPVVAAQH